MNTQFGTNNNLELGKVQPLLDIEIKRINLTLGDLFEFGKIGELKLTPEKGYHARAEVDVRGKGYDLQARMPILLFLPNNGTGDRKTFSQYSHLEPAWTPRAKEGEAEAFFSIGTGYNNLWFSGLTSLAGVTIKKPGDKVHTIKEYRRFTTHPTEFMSDLLDASEFDHHKKRRTDFTFDKQAKIGNPHAIIFDEREKFPRLMNYDNLFQVAGFLHFPEKSPALDILKDAHARHLETLVR